ncbi:MAG: DUF805 domain-containing protein [ANME-2 cluster archaeon]|nr:MAG: DUF805 domain-containing protein [ANME-2 cluster archaeon]
MKWYLSVLIKYATFKGRARRTEFWMFSLINFAISFILSILGYLSIDGSGQYRFFSIIYLLYGIAVLVPGIAVTVRRFHDIGKNGWWIFIVLVPIIGWILMLTFLFSNSEPGDNQYGSNPKSATNQFAGYRTNTEKNAWAQAMVGAEFMSEHRYNDALVISEQALAKCPHCKEAWVVKGGALTMLNRVGEALDCYEQALTIDPNYEEASLQKELLMKSLASKKQILNPKGVPVGGEKGTSGSGTSPSFRNNVKDENRSEGEMEIGFDMLKMQLDAYNKGIKYLNECGPFNFDKYKEAHRIAKSPVEEAKLREMWESYGSETIHEMTIELFTRLVKKTKDRIAT